MERCCRPDKAQPPSGKRCHGDNAGWRVARLSGLPKRAYSDTSVAFICNMAARGCVPAEIGEPKREWQGLDAMDGGQRRTETWSESRNGRASRVEPAAVRHAGGERSAQHRFPRGAAGIDKGSAAASLIPFTAPVSKIFRRTLGERNHSTVVNPLLDGT